MILISVYSCAAMAELPRGITARPTLVLVKLGNEIAGRAPRIRWPRSG